MASRWSGVLSYFQLDGKHRLNQNFFEEALQHRLEGDNSLIMLAERASHSYQNTSVGCAQTRGMQIPRANPS